MPLIEHLINAVRSGKTPEQVLNEAVQNPYAVCVSSIEKSTGKKKEDFTKDELDRLDQCIKEVKGESLIPEDKAGDWDKMKQPERYKVLWPLVHKMVSPRAILMMSDQVFAKLPSDVQKMISNR